MDIRRLQPDDTDTFRTLRLSALQREPSAFGASFDEESSQPVDLFLSWLAPHPDNAVFGAFVDSSLIGCAGLRRENLAKLRHKGIVWGMYVAPGYRRSGAGRKLLDAVIRFAEQVEGLRQLNLCVNADNSAAIALYKQCGFEIFGTEKDAMNIDGTFVDELHMTRRLC